MSVLERTQVNRERESGRKPPLCLHSGGEVLALTRSSRIVMGKSNMHILTGWARALCRLNRDLVSMLHRDRSSPPLKVNTGIKGGGGIKETPHDGSLPLPFTEDCEDSLERKKRGTPLYAVAPSRFQQLPSLFLVQSFLPPPAPLLPRQETSELAAAAFWSRSLLEVLPNRSAVVPRPQYASPPVMLRLKGRSTVCHMQTNLKKKKNDGEPPPGSSSAAAI